MSDLEELVSIGSVDGIDLVLAKLYKSLQTRQSPVSANDRPPVSPLEHAIEDVISWMAEERGFSVNYQISIRQSLLKLANWIEETRGGKALNAIRIEDLTAFLAAEKERGLTSGSLRLITIALQMFFRVLKNCGDVKQDPAKMLEAPKVRSRLPQVLKRDEINRLLSVDLATRPYPLRDRAILELFYSSGIRLSELTGATLENLSLPERMIRITGKGNKTRIVPVTSVACDAIGDYLASERPRWPARVSALKFSFPAEGERCPTRWSG